MPISMRINKYISQSGLCSKRQADRLIAAGQVTVNGDLARVGLLVSEQDKIVVRGEPLDAKPEAVYLLYHKPIGVVCTNDQTVTGNLVGAINYPQRVFAVGRLDKASEGLLLLTNDGDVFNKILRAEHAHQKEYLVTVNSPLTEDFLAQMRAGVLILDTITLPCQVAQINSTTFNIILTQGLNLQIRRMCQALGYRVLKLQRIRIMNLQLDSLPVNQYRALTSPEMTQLQALLNTRA